MVYASSKDALKRALGEGLGKEVQANDHGDLAWDSVLEQISRMDRQWEGSHIAFYPSFIPNTPSLSP